MLYLFVLLLLVVIVIIVITVYNPISFPSNPIPEAPFSIESFNNYHHLLMQKDSGDRIKIPILYINLDDNSKRRNFIEEQFKKYRITNYQRISGILGKKYNITGDILQDGTRFVNEYPISNSELGCTLSHLIAIRTAYTSGYQQSMIIEDDACFNLMPFWNDDLSNLVEKIPDDWDIIQLYHPNISNKYTRNFQNGTVAYLINRKGMEKILNLFYNDNTFYLTADKSQSPGVADDLIYRNVNTYCIGTPLIYTYNNELDMESQIHTSHTTDHIKISHRIIEEYICKEYCILVYTTCPEKDPFGEAITIIREYFIKHGKLIKVFNLRLEDKLPDEINKYNKCLVFGGNLICNREITFPDNTIIINMEQLYDNSPWNNRKYLNILKHYDFWDYNTTNLAWLENKIGKRGKLFELGYSECLKFISNEEHEKDIDVLFYGSFNDRRMKIYNELKDKGLNVVFRDDLWGLERWKLISRSKIILNIHYYPCKYFEPLRILPLVINGKFVINEDSSINNDYQDIKDCIVTVPYESLVETVITYLNNDNKRDIITNKGLHVVKRSHTKLPIEI